MVSVRRFARPVGVRRVARGDGGLAADVGAGCGNLGVAEMARRPGPVGAAAR
jgi:hypothetical protein